VLLPLLSSYFGIGDCPLGMVALLARASTSVCYALASTPLMMYLGRWPTWSAGRIRRRRLTDSICLLFFVAFEKFQSISIVGQLRVGTRSVGVSIVGQGIH